jgi:ribosomal-protein-alanine N-acetyltransferase
MTSSSDQRSESASDVRVRRIDTSQIADLIYIGQSVHLSPWTAESYLAELKNPDAIMLRLVSGENKTIGFVVGRFVGSGGAEPDAEIYNIAVKESEQSKGNGQLLFDAFFAICRDRGVKTLWLEVRQSNHKAIAFYERNGFESVQRRSHFYENPREHGWLMRLDMNIDKA